MRWRFADFPLRTKIMVTLGIPVLGMVLLIAKQVDSSVKRLTVIGYIGERAKQIELYANVMHEVQRESALSVGYLSGMNVLPMKLGVQYSRTDGALLTLEAPGLPDDVRLHETRPFDGLNILRQRVQGERIEADRASRAYRAMDQALLDEVGRVGKLALDPETKDRMYAHLRLLNAKDALSALRDKLTIGYASRPVAPTELAELGELISTYETNLLLFERDAPPEVLTTYQQVFQGDDVNFMRSLIGTVKQRRSPDLSIAPREWWELSLEALDKLREVEVHSLDLIVANTTANTNEAESRLFIVLLSLVGVIGAVVVMGILITRGIRNTVREVGGAARSLAVGDV
ncbi:MAG TPA: nitrate- and nitrite sensing domain-containing protein, partial [Flavobacteriales bacterium]|nr:nitrate- and nitrite sensing domain-containing protein [Flavobacteriales bacterium]